MGTCLPSRCLETVLVYLPISRSSHSNGSTPYDMYLKGFWQGTYYYITYAFETVNMYSWQWLFMNDRILPVLAKTKICWGASEWSSTPTHTVWLTASGYLTLTRFAQPPVSAAFLLRWLTYLEDGGDITSDMVCFLELHDIITQKALRNLNNIAA
jgi:hypothetical protein